MFGKRFDFKFESRLEIEIGSWEKISSEQQTKISNDDLYLTTPQLIEKNGFECETHTVTTEDGYILTLHRIPHGRQQALTTGANNLETNRRPVALIQPGAFCSSAVFVMTPADRSIAFRLADQGFDVFLANTRGTTYSKRHKTLSLSSKEYWNFSWHEIGLYDVPANIDYILNLTGQQDLYYLGHSMGTTIFFVCMSVRPEYNSKIRLCSALAPVAFMEHLVSPCGHLAPFVRQIHWLTQVLGINQLFPNNFIFKFLGLTVGHQSSPLQALLTHLLFILCGYNEELLDKDILPIILGHVPAGIAAKCLKHYAQGINSGEFRQYNYGPKNNQVLYGQSTPPDYDLSKITAPVALYYSNNDWLAGLPDVHRLSYMLPNVVKKYRVPFDKFNHMDFLWGLKAPSLVFETMETEMQNYEPNNQFLEN